MVFTWRWATADTCKITTSAQSTRRLYCFSLRNTMAVRWSFPFLNHSNYLFYIRLNIALRVII